MAISDDLRDDAATNAASGISSASVDGRSSAALSPIVQFDAADRIQANAVAAASLADGNFVGRILGRRARCSPPEAF